jgi:hypothetical protein
MSGRDSRDRFTWTPDVLQRVDGLEPCAPVPHEAHYDEHGSCPGFIGPEVAALYVGGLDFTGYPADELRVEERLEANYFDPGEDDYGDWFSGADQ